MNTANPCATRGASYIFHATPQNGNNCGNVPDQLININPDGTMNQTVKCDSVTQDGCTARDTNCTETVNGCTVSVNTDVTFSNDGATASGYEQVNISCADGNSCDGLYSVTAVRQ